MAESGDLSAGGVRTTQRLRGSRLQTQIRVLDLLQRGARLLGLDEALVCEAQPGGGLRVLQALGSRFRVGEAAPDLDNLRERMGCANLGVTLSQDLSSEAWASPARVEGLKAAIVGRFSLGTRWHLVALFSSSARQQPFEPAAEDTFRLLLEGVRAHLQRLQVEEELRRADDRFRRSFHLGPLASAILDPDGRWVTLNDRLCALLGRSREDLLATDWRSLTLHKKRREERDLYRRLVAGEIDRAQVAESFVRPDGSVVPTRVSARVLRRTDGQVESLVVLIEDLSDERRVQLERERLQEQLLQAQKIESVGLLAGGIAHDFNNLLTGVLGNAHLMRLDIDEDHKASPPLENLLDAAQRAARLTRQLLAYSGQRALEFRGVDVSREVQKQSSLLDRVIPKRVELRLDLGVALPQIQADEAQLQQAVMNLAINGAEACDKEGGTVWLRTGSSFLDPKVPDDYVLPPERAGLYAWVEVLDTGRGMTPDTIAKAFDPFFSTKFTGRGLGLAAVAGIVRSHHGAIKVTSKPEEGSMFRLFFPCAGEDSSVEPEAGEGRQAVVVIDDEEAVRRVCAAVLKRDDWEVHSASGGVEGVALLRKTTPTLALVDMTMPDIDGVETARRLRAELPGLPILFMSGFAEFAVRDQLPSEGNYSFLHKPFTPKQLIEAVGETLSEAEPE